MVPSGHKAFIDNAAEIFKEDRRIMGVAAGGSYITGSMDEFSDIDFVIAVDPAHAEQVLKERQEIAGKLGNLLCSFTGEHVGEPRLLICLYGPPLLHVDLKFVSLEDIYHRVEDPVILWERDNRISEAFKRERAEYPMPDMQWLEDRFWVWIHYCAAKIGRREIFETIEAISFLRQTVIGPLALMKSGCLPRGVRKIETDAPQYLPQLKRTVAGCDAPSCIDALKNIMQIYRELRDYRAEQPVKGAGNAKRFGAVTRRSEAEKYAEQYLGEIEKQAARGR